MTWSYQTSLKLIPVSPVLASNDSPGADSTDKLLKSHSLLIDCSESSIHLLPGTLIKLGDSGKQSCS